MENQRKPGGMKAQFQGVLLVVVLAALMLGMRWPRVKAYRWAAGILQSNGQTKSANDLRNRAYVVEHGLSIIYYLYKSAKEREAFDHAVKEFHRCEVPASPNFSVSGVSEDSPNRGTVLVTKEFEKPLRRYLRDRGFATD